MCIDQWSALIKTVDMTSTDSVSAIFAPTIVASAGDDSASVVVHHI